MNDFEMIEQARRKAAQRRRTLVMSSGGHGAAVVAAGLASVSASLAASYTIVRELHRGGQGVVYLARQKTPARDVAIKVLRQGPLSGPNEQARFEREVQILATLRHPNVVTIHESGRAAGFFYYVMDYIDGRPLDVAVREDNAPPPNGDAARSATIAALQPFYAKKQIERVVRLFATICEAVSAAHLRGIIHRDLKPGNVLIDAEGVPHVLDFGLARVFGEALNDSPTVTRTGQFIGSPPWASPEQAEGRDAIDLRTDVYSLGVMLFHALTREFPYRVNGGIREVIENIVTAAAPPPSRRNSAIDHDIDTIVLKCLSKEAERRYQSAGELGADLRRYLAGEPIDARRASTLYVLGKTLRRHRVAAMLLSILLFTVLTSIAVVGFLWRDSIAQRDAVEAERKTAEAERKTAAAERRIGEERAETIRRSAYCLSIGAADVAWKDINPTAMVERLDECPPDLRGWEWKFLNRFRDTSIALHPAHRSSTNLVLSPDGGTLVSFSFDQSIYVWDWPARAITRQFRTDFMVQSVAIPPDASRLIAGSRANRIYFADLTIDAPGELRRLALPNSTRVAWAGDGRMIAIGAVEDNIALFTPDLQRRIATFQTGGGLAAIAFSPDGSLLASGFGDGQVRIWDIESRTVRGVLDFHSRRIAMIAFTPDQRRLLSASDDNYLVVWNLASQTPDFVIACDLGNSSVFAISPDGASVAVATGRAIRTWSLTTGLECASHFGPSGNVRGITYAADGRTLISSDERGDIREWDVNRPQRPAVLTGHTETIRDVAISPDSRFVASASEDRTVRIWNLESGEEWLRLSGHMNQVWGVAWSSDGRTIASTGWDQSLRVWDAETGAPLAAYQTSSTQSESVAISPDGRRIAVGNADGCVEEFSLDSDRVAVFRAPRDRIMGMAYAPGGRQLAIASDSGPMIVYDVASGEPVLEIPRAHSGTHCVAFSPDGRIIASGGAGARVRLWSAADGRMLKELAGHPAIVQGVAFSPDGSRLVSSCFGGHIILWDPDLGLPLLTFRDHESGVSGIAWSPDGGTIVSGSHDSTLRVWNANR